MEVGLRVVRGPDWKWQHQDDGEGHIGTVVEIGRAGSTTSPDKTVVVQWDSGYRTNYRVGYHGSYDLRVFNNASIGVKHQNIICDGCHKQGIHGMRWKCTKTYDYDLCTECYMSDEHDLHHSFVRYDTPASSGVKVPKRSGSTPVQSRGIFPGATVVRGPDWDWGLQDGGEGNQGTVIDIRGWDNESHYSVANVKWSTGTTNVYRLGHKGKVDIKYTSDASGSQYYSTHLPVLGKTVAEKTEATIKNPLASQFKVGDRVRVDLEPDILKAMQDGHGGWNPRMAEYVGKVGHVHRITERGDVRVQYEGCSNRWTFHAGALTKVNSFSVGDIVKVSDSMTHIKSLQKGHGEWANNMKTALGKIGRVQKVYTDGDLRVNVSGHTWTFNPACCSAAPNTQQDLNNTMADHEPAEQSNSFDTLLELLQIQSPGSGTGPEKLVREAAQGHLDAVKDILVKHPDKVDAKSSGKTALQVACHQGHAGIMAVLMGAGANMEACDDDGDTALHYSAFGNQPEFCELLLNKGANINATNKGGCTTLHVAVNKQQVKCVQMLLRYKCDVNLQDLYGDTALHDAIGKDSQEVVERLVSYPGVDFSLKNKRGFNVLHHAALKGNNHATRQIATNARQIVDIKKEDGFGSLHLAALNGHKEVALTLITVGKADVEIKNNRKQTPLLLAVSQGHIPLIILLVSKASADLDADDEDGDTCLHLALMRRTVALDAESCPELAAIRTKLTSVSSSQQSGVALACYLAQYGADIHRPNLQGKTPVGMVTDPKVTEVLQEYAALGQSWSSKLFAEKARLNPVCPPPPPMECLLCEEEPATLIFEPCGHKVVCADCGTKMKKCVSCFTPITKKVVADGNFVQFSTERCDAVRNRRAGEEDAGDGGRLQLLHMLGERAHGGVSLWTFRVHPVQSTAESLPHVPQTHHSQNQSICVTTSGNQMTVGFYRNYIDVRTVPLYSVPSTAAGS